MRMLRDDGIEFLLKLQDLLGLDLDIRCLTLYATQRLVDHHTTMGQSRTLALLTCHEQHSTHRGSHTCADGGDIARDKLHGIIDTQSCCHAATRRVDIDRDILARVHRVEIEQLSLKGIGCVVVDLGTKEDDTIHHQS